MKYGCFFQRDLFQGGVLSKFLCFQASQKEVRCFESGTSGVLCGASPAIAPGCWSLSELYMPILGPPWFDVVPLRRAGASIIHKVLGTDHSTGRTLPPLMEVDGASPKGTSSSKTLLSASMIVGGSVCFCGWLLCVKTHSPSWFPTFCPRANPKESATFHISRELGLLYTPDNLL